jgi:hypothetical protein
MHARNISDAVEVHMIRLGRYLVVSWLLQLALILVTAVDARAADSIVGVWLTKDASDELGKQQGGLVLRPDGTGVMLATTWQTNTSGMSEEIKTLFAGVGLESGKDDFAFKYTATDTEVTMSVTAFKGMPVSSSTPVVWTYQLKSPMELYLSRESEHQWMLLMRAQ